LRLGSPVLAEKVTDLINFCILNRSLPSEWKQARLTPVFKRGVDTDKTDYRPVSILTSLSKVFEKVIYDQTWIAFHNVLSSNLSGIMKTHSCCTVLLKMTEDWRNSVDNKEAVAAVAVDLSKALDAINYSLLLAKLKAYGFSTHVLELMSTYLLGHQQCVRLDGVCSNFKTVKPPLQNLEARLIRNHQTAEALLSMTPQTPVKIPFLSNFLKTHPNETFVANLTAGLTEGFRVGYQGNHLPKTAKNIPSAYRHPLTIEGNLLEEVQRSRLAGPFEFPLPFPNFHIHHRWVGSQKEEPKMAHYFTPLFSQRDP